MESILPNPSDSETNVGTADPDRSDIGPELEKIWRKHFPELYRRSLAWMNGRREDAEDALGQAAVVALQKLPRDLPPAELRKWLLRLVYSKCMDIHRERWRISRHLVAGFDASSLEALAILPSLEAAGLEGELLAFVMSYIRQLPPRLRSVTELHFLREAPYSEVAERLDLTEVNVRKRVQHARAILRERLEDYLRGNVAPRAAPAARLPRETVSASPPRPAARWSVALLRAYVQRHPRGWKKRWELALRLREEGLLDEAVVQLREAAGRQPRRVELWIALGESLCALGRAGEAVAAYEAALPWLRSEAGRRHLQDRIASCRRAAEEAG